MKPFDFLLWIMQLQLDRLDHKKSLRKPETSMGQLDGKKRKLYYIFLFASCWTDMKNYANKIVVNNVDFF